MYVPRQCIEQQYYHDIGRMPQLTDEKRRDHEREFLRFFGDLVSQEYVALQLPTLHIGALCHAADGWDKRRRLEGNDLYDFHPAQAATPYCDAFLTEKSFCRFLQQRRLGLAKDFSCTMMSGIAEAAAWLSNRIDA